MVTKYFHCILTKRPQFKTNFEIMKMMKWKSGFFFLHVQKAPWQGKAITMFSKLFSVLSCPTWNPNMEREWNICCRGNHLFNSLRMAWSSEVMQWVLNTRYVGYPIGYKVSSIIIPPPEFLPVDWHRAGHMTRYRNSYQEIVPDNGR